jgi:hypothetical protein
MTQPRSSRPFLQTALNEDRMHPAAPHTPAQIVARGAGRGACRRAIGAPLDADSDTAVAHVEAFELTLAEAGMALEQVHHGDGIASWAVNRRAIPRDTAFGPVWRTRRFCPTGAWPTATATSLRLPPRCSPTARLNSRAAIRRHLTA